MIKMMHLWILFLFLASCGTPLGGDDMVYVFVPPKVYVTHSGNHVKKCLDHDENEEKLEDGHIDVFEEKEAMYRGPGKCMEPSNQDFLKCSDPKAKNIQVTCPIRTYGIRKNQLNMAIQLSFFECKDVMPCTFKKHPMVVATQKPNAQARGTEPVKFRGLKAQPGNRPVPTAPLPSIPKGTEDLSSQKEHIERVKEKALKDFIGLKQEKKANGEEPKDVAEAQGHAPDLGEAENPAPGPGEREENEGQPKGPDSPPVVSGEGSPPEEQQSEERDSAGGVSNESRPSVFSESVLPPPDPEPTTIEGKMKQAAFTQWMLEFLGLEGVFD